jgi:hypothetical protein
MTSVNLSAVFDTAQFWDIGLDTYENSPITYRKEVEEKLFSVYRENGDRKLYDYDELRRLNTSESLGINEAYSKSNVFDSESREHIQKIRDKFFKR